MMKFLKLGKGPVGVGCGHLYGMPAKDFKAGETTYEDMAEIKDDKQKANVVYNYALLLDTTGKTDEAISKYMEVLEFSYSKHLAYYCIQEGF